MCSDLTSYSPIWHIFSGKQICCHLIGTIFSATISICVVMSMGVLLLESRYSCEWHWACTQGIILHINQVAKECPLQYPSKCFSLNEELPRKSKHAKENPSIEEEGSPATPPPPPPPPPRRAWSPSKKFLGKVLARRLRSCHILGKILAKILARNWPA